MKENTNPDKMEIANIVRIKEEGCDILSRFI
jgi:hypothetical protein